MVAFLEGARFAAEEADVFVVEIDVEELANLALIVADVAAQIGEFGGEFVEGLRDGGGATVDFGLAVREAAEGGGDFDNYGHFHCSSFKLLGESVHTTGATTYAPRCVRGGHELRIHKRFERFEARCDGVGQRVFGGDGVGGFQAVAGDADDRGFVGRDATLVDQFFCDAGGNAAGGLRKDAFGFGQQLDGGDDFGVGDVFGPAAGFADLLEA